MRGKKRRWLSDGEIRARELVLGIAKDIGNEYEKRKQYQEKQTHEPTKLETLQLEARKLLQELTKKIDVIESNSLELKKKFVQESLVSIIEYLQKSETDISVFDVAKVLKSLESTLKIIEEMGELNTSGNKGHYTYLHKFYVDLMSKIPEFAYFAPKEAFLKDKFAFTKLGPEKIGEVRRLFVKKGYMDDPRIQEMYAWVWSKYEESPIDMQKVDEVAEKRKDVVFTIERDMAIDELNEALSKQEQAEIKAVTSMGVKTFKLITSNIDENSTDEEIAEVIHTFRTNLQVIKDFQNKHKKLKVYKNLVDSLVSFDPRFSYLLSNEQIDVVSSGIGV